MKEINIKLLLSIFLSSFVVIISHKLNLFDFINFVPLVDYVIYIFLLFLSFLFMLRMKFKDTIFFKDKYLVYILIFFTALYLNFNNSFSLYPSVTLNLFLFSFFIFFLLVFYLRANLNHKFFHILSLLVLFCLFLLISQFFILTYYSTYINLNFQNLSSVLLPIINTKYGSYPPILSQSFYGYYSYFLFPFIFLSDFLLENITFLFFVLFIISLSFIYYFINYYLRDHFLSLLIFLISFYILTSFANVWPGDLYYQYRPIRMLSPCLSLLLFISFQRSPAEFKLHLYLLLLSFLTIWNLDTGIFALFAFAITITFINFLKSNYKGYMQIILFKPLFFCLVYLSLAWILFGILVYILTSEIIQLDQIIEPFIAWRGSELFFSFSPQPIIISILFTSIAFIYSFHRLLIKKNLKENQAQLFLSILCFGLLTYGSRNPSTSAISSYLIPLLLVFPLKQNKNKLFSMCIISSLAFISIFIALFANDLRKNPGFYTIPTFLEMKISNFKNNKGLWYKPGENVDTSLIVTLKDVRDLDLKPLWLLKAEWVKNNIKKIYPNDTDKIFIASEADHLFYMYLKKTIPVNMINWHHVTHFNRWTLLYKMVSNKDVDLIVVDHTFFLRNADTKGGDIYMKFEERLNENYKLYDSKIFGFSWFYPTWRESPVEIWVRK